MEKLYEKTINTLHYNVEYSALQYRIYFRIILVFLL